MSLVRATGLAAAYDGRTVFAGLDLDLGPGVYALTGRNGTGKSTLLRLLAGAEAPAAGAVEIAGNDLVRQAAAARRALGYAPDACPAYPFMTGADFLDAVAAAKATRPGPVVAGLIDGFGLGPHLSTRIDALSLGTQTKLTLAAAWIGAPRVLLLDEPSNALDALARECLAARIVADAHEAAIVMAIHDDDFVAMTGARPLPLATLAAAA